MTAFTTAPSGQPKASSSSRTPSLDIGVFGIRGIPSSYSGYETFLTSLLPELVDRGHQVTCYSRRGRGEQARGYRGVHVYPLPSLETKQLDTVTHALPAAFAAALTGHDVVLVCNTANVPFLWALRKVGVPSVLNVDGQEWLRGKWGRVARMVFWQCARYAGQSATALVADCNAMRDVFLSEFNADSTVIPYAAPPVDLRCAGSKSGRDLVGDSKPYFVAGGRLIPENNLVEIASAYSSTSSPHALAVLGAANYDSPVKRQLEEIATRDKRIRLVGHIDNRIDYLTILRDAVGYIHGHSVGGMNPSLVEAMAVGARVAVLATEFNLEVGGPAVLSFDNCDGALKSCISLMLDMQPAEEEFLRALATSRATERFDIASVASAYEALLLRVANRDIGSTEMVTAWDRRSPSYVP